MFLTLLKHILFAWMYVQVTVSSHSVSKVLRNRQSKKTLYSKLEVFKSLFHTKNAEFTAAKRTDRDKVLNRALTKQELLSTNKICETACVHHVTREANNAYYK